MITSNGHFLYGLTGGVASGKSTVGKLMRSAGVHVIDADVLARRAVEPGQPALAQIEQRFGSTVVQHGKLDRQTLGKIVFSNPEALGALNAIIHPRVAELLERELALIPFVATEAPQLVCYEVPLLFENGLDHWLRPVVLVACSEQHQVARAVAREGWTEEHARQRIRAQLPLRVKHEKADFVIQNDGTFQDLEQSTASTLAELRRMAMALTPSSAV